MKRKELLFTLENKKKFNAILNYNDNISDYSAVIAHGANNDMKSPLLEKLAHKLCEKDIPVLRFNFPYRYENRKSPDGPKILKSAWLKSYQFMRNHNEFPSKKMIIIGKSLGGRIAAEVSAAKSIAPDIIVFLGYPMHAPGRKDNIKDESLYLIDAPMIFVSGTKDPLCDKNILERVDKKLGESSYVYLVEGGGHSLAFYRMKEEDENEHFDFISSEVCELILKTV